MPPPSSVRLGSITRSVLNRSCWSANSVFPATQDWADEVERVLSFLEAQTVLDDFLPRLAAREWEGALAEARAGFFFHRNGFRILRWEPEAVQGRPGDLEIRWRDTLPIFVELKGSGWEGELTPNEIAAGRQHSDKCINAEARAVGPIGRVVYAMEKALPKLDASRGNLVVVVDDLFISPTELPKGCLASSLAHKIKATDFRPISGLFLINPVSYGSPVEYRKYFVANPNAVTALPDTVAEGLSMGNADPQAPRWARE